MSELYPNLGFDPAPGDITVADDIAATIRNVADQAARTHTTMTSVSEDNGIWVGHSADAFSESFEDVPPYLQRAVTSLEAAARTLERWSDALHGFQTRARQLEDEAEIAQSSVTAAETALNEVEDEDADAEGLRSDREEKLSLATSSLTDVQGRAQVLKTEHTDAAKTTARELDDAGDDAPAKPGLFTAISDLVNGIVELVTNPDFWKGLGDLLAHIAAVIGVVCLALMIFASGPAGWLVWAAIIASAAALGAHGTAMAMGHEDVSWTTLAFDAAGIVTGGVGLVASNIIRAGRSMVQAGRGLRSGAFRDLRFGDWASGVLKTAEGHVTTFFGTVLDWSAAIAGNTAAGTDYGMNPSIPIIGPITDIVGAWNDGDRAPGDHSESAAESGGEVTTEAVLEGAETSFINGIDDQYGTAA